ncbi:unnamed protein product [Linum tenue]|uniref:Malectin-like domain-containing protein n=1 Tax=Linum tenue TaxID=586396 RepID=A0AAV0M9F9_9ROSI|nr:unnamed protein product [Linum tenue]
MLQWTNIDCGNEDLPPIGLDLLIWHLDTNYTTTGIKARLSIPTPRPELDTLRFFPDATARNCYAVPSVKLSLKYLVRAGFYYGNYDAYGRPPTFDVHLDGRKWTTVNTTTAQGAVYYEAVYVTQGKDEIELCLVQTRRGEVPFVSSVEMVPLWDGLYSEMGNEESFALVARTNLEWHNRIWTRGLDPPNTTVAATVAPLPLLTPTENEPPPAALSDSVQSNNAQNTISLTVDIPKSTSNQQTAAYLVLYFTELLIRPKLDDTRVMDVYVDGKMTASVEAELTKCKVATVYPIAVQPDAVSINVTLARANSSTLPPMVSAMEVFTRIESSGAGAGGGGGGSKSTGGGGRRRLVVASCAVVVHVVSILFISLF